MSVQSSSMEDTGNYPEDTETRWPCRACRVVMAVESCESTGLQYQTQFKI